MSKSEENVCQADFDERRLVADFTHVGNEEGRAMAVAGVRVEIPESFFARASALVGALNDAGADCATYWSGFAAMPLVVGPEGTLVPTSDFGDSEVPDNGRGDVVVAAAGGVEISMWSFDDNMAVSCYLGTVEELHVKFNKSLGGIPLPQLYLYSKSE
jgi:hypothetical protein